MTNCPDCGIPLNLFTMSCPKCGLTKREIILHLDPELEGLMDRLQEKHGPNSILALLPLAFNRGKQ